MSPERALVQLLEAASELPTLSWGIQNITGLRHSLSLDAKRPRVSD